MEHLNYLPDEADYKLPMPEPFEEDSTKMDLYDWYGLPHESFETFCDRMYNDYGPGWQKHF